MPQTLQVCCGSASNFASAMRSSINVCLAAAHLQSLCKCVAAPPKTVSVLRPHTYFANKLQTLQVHCVFYHVPNVASGLRLCKCAASPHQTLQVRCGPASNFASALRSSIDVCLTAAQLHGKKSTSHPTFKSLNIARARTQSAWTL